MLFEMKKQISWPHLLLAVAVVAVWGSNFVVIKWGLAQLPPLLFATLRFALVAFPLVLLLPRPAVPWRNLAGYGLCIGLGQFGLLFLAMNGHIAPGLASLVVQTQVFFTIGLTLVLQGERPNRVQWVALLLAASGLAVIGAHTDAHTSVLGLALVLGAALAWAGGNLFSRAAGRVNMVAYVTWSSLWAAPPLALLSLAVEGWPRISTALIQADASAWAAVVWQSVGNSLFGYAAWGWLLARYSAATITPMALLVPVFGMGSAALALAEPLPAWKLGAAALVLSGLALNLLWPWLQKRRNVSDKNDL
ncbi:MAG: EamA family transporter [Rhodoferax sp.]